MFLSTEDELIDLTKTVLAKQFYLIPMPSETILQLGV